MFKNLKPFAYLFSVLILLIGIFIFGLHNPQIPRALTISAYLTGLFYIYLLFDTAIHWKPKSHIWLITYIGTNTKGISKPGRLIAEIDTDTISPSLIITIEHYIKTERFLKEAIVSHAEYLGFWNYEQQVTDVVRRTRNG